MPPHHSQTICRLAVSAAVCAMIVFRSNCPAQDTPAPSKASKDDTVKIAGVFESTRQSEVSANKEHLTDLEIVRVLPFGTVVEKGQSLVWFDPEKMDEKVSEAETDLELAKLTLEADQFAHEQFLKLQALDRDKAKRSRKHAQQDHDNYQRVDREAQIKQAKNNLEGSKFSLDSATEEYRQLEQMYQEDDLTEESEEIVLRRAKWAMERAAHSLERTQNQTDRTIKQSIPRNDSAQEDALARALIEYDKKMHDMATAKKKRQIELERKEKAFQKQADEFKEMQSERKETVVKSEIGGIFFHGPLTRGKLGSKPVLHEKGASVKGKQIIGVVADPTRLQVRVDLPEDRITLVKKGVTCKIVPKGNSEVSFRGVVQSVSTVPFINGKFDCVVEIEGKPKDVMPGMNCDLLFSDPDAQGKADASDSDSGDKSE